MQEAQTVSITKGNEKHKLSTKLARLGRAWNWGKTKLWRNHDNFRSLYINIAFDIDFPSQQQMRREQEITESDVIFRFAFYADVVNYKLIITSCFSRIDLGAY